MSLNSKKKHLGKVIFDCLVQKGKTIKDLSDGTGYDFDFLKNVVDGKEDDNLTFDVIHSIEEELGVNVIWPNDIHTPYKELNYDMAIIPKVSKDNKKMNIKIVDGGHAFKPMDGMLGCEVTIKHYNDDEVEISFEKKIIKFIGDEKISVDELRWEPEDIHVRLIDEVHDPRGFLERLFNINKHKVKVERSKKRVVGPMEWVHFKSYVPRTITMKRENLVIIDRRENA